MYPPNAEGTVRSSGALDSVEVNDQAATAAR